MPRTDAINQDIRDQQRDNVLTAALSLFARHGWSTTMSEIAQQAGVSQGLAYHYFSGKEEIFRVLVDKAMAHGFVRATMQREQPATLRLGDLLSVILDPGGLPMQYYQFVMQVVRDRSLPESLRPILETQAQEFVQSLSHLIMEAQDAGDVLQCEPQQLAITLFALINGLTLLGIRGNPDVLAHFPDPTLILHLIQNRVDR